MKQIQRQVLTGERALFQSKDLEVLECVFEDGESPLKESSDLEIKNTLFRWKYPLWYCNNITVTDSTFFAGARAGVWYTNNAFFERMIIEAPKSFRRCDGLTLEDIEIPHADETMWNCKNVSIKNVRVCGNYFAMGCENVEAENLTLMGDYGFDGAKNITIRNSRLLTKDAFWNCENVTVIDSFISGEYFGWNAKKVTLINCTIESLQGMCYMKELVMKNCRLLNTTLAFEYSTVDADIKGKIDSVKNPSAGVIRCESIDELIMEPDKVDVAKTQIITEK